MILLVLAAVTFVYLFVCHAIGTLVERDATPGAALASGTAIAAHVLFLLGLAGALDPLVTGAIFAILAVAGLLRGRGGRFHAAPVLIGSAALIPAFVLGAFPPNGFDETLYHLAFVKAFAASHSLPFVAELRVPVFPQLVEVLAVPAWMLAGDVATHAVSLVATLATLLLVWEWGARYSRSAGLLAAAFYCGSPIVVGLAGTLYVEPALTLWIVAAFERLDRWGGERRTTQLAAAGAFMGTACATKYLAGWFAVCALAIILFSWRRWEDASSRRVREGGPAEHRRVRPSAAAAVYCAATLAAAAAVYARIVVMTGNPLFPFAPSVFGSSLWDPVMPSAQASEVAGFLSTPFNVTFARHRAGFQPPFTPWFIPALLLMLAVALRRSYAVADAGLRSWARVLSAVVFSYLLIFQFLPADARYLVPLLPLLAVGVGRALPLRGGALTLAALVLALPGLAYGPWRLVAREGFPPRTPVERDVYLDRKITGYEALRRSSPWRLYGCGSEQLEHYGEERFTGDHTGPNSYQRVVGGTADASVLEMRLRRRGLHGILVTPAGCGPDPRTFHGFGARFRLLLRDRSGTEVWLLRSSGSSQAAVPPP